MNPGGILFFKNCWMPLNAVPEDQRENANTQPAFLRATVKRRFDLPKSTNAEDADLNWLKSLG